jgi:tripartite-type tricarboxylate transporter receptor subunit TctC
MNQRTPASRRSVVFSACATLCLGGMLKIASAQDAAANFPNKPITFVVPYAAGGSSDVRARQIGQKLSTYFGQPVVIDNKSGANGNIGTTAIARAAPDGYTIGIGNLAPLTVNKTLTPHTTPFDPVNDLVPVALLERGPILLLVNAEKSPHKDVKSLINTLKDPRSKASYASAGLGGAYHLAAEIFKANTNTYAVHIPYRSGGQAINDLLAGQVDFMFDMAPAVLSYVNGTPPKMRALAVANDKRLASLPDVPTLAELGYKNMELSNWLGVIAPKGTPPAIIDKLNKAINRALQEPDIAQRITGPGNIIGGGEPKVFADLLASETKRWTTLIKEKGIKAE